MAPVAKGRCLVRAWGRCSCLTGAAEVCDEVEAAGPAAGVAGRDDPALHAEVGRRVDAPLGQRQELLLPPRRHLRPKKGDEERRRLAFGQDASRGNFRTGHRRCCCCCCDVTEEEEEEEEEDKEDEGVGALTTFPSPSTTSTLQRELHSARWPADPAAPGDDKSGKESARKRRRRKLECFSSQCASVHKPLPPSLPTVPTRTASAIRTDKP